VSEAVVVSRSNPPVPVEQRIRMVLSVLSGELTLAEAARRRGVSPETVASLEDGMPGPGGRAGSVVERRQRAQIEQLKLTLAEATV
jgi:transposase